MEEQSADEQAHVEHHTHRAKELKALIRIQTAVSSSLALDEVLGRALEATLAVTEMEVGEVWLLDTAPREVRLARCYGLDSGLFEERTRFALGEGIPGRVAQSGEVIIIPDLATDPRFLRRRVVEAGFKTFAAFPLRAKGEVVGSLDVAARQVRAFTEDDVQFLTSIGAAVGMAVANAHLYESLRLAVKQLEAKLEDLERTQVQLIAAGQLRATGRTTTAPPAPTMP